MLRPFRAACSAPQPVETYDRRATRGVASRTRRRFGMKSLLCGAAGCAIGLSGVGARAQPPELQASAPTVIVDTAEMRNDGMMFPDTPISFLRTGDGRLVAFAAGGSIKDIGPGVSVVPFGTYMFVGTFDHLSPATSSGNWPTPALVKGRDQPSPDGRDFDRDYAGGGPTFPVGPSALMQIYHGEYHCTSSIGIPAYGGSGVAVSHDGGKSFQKLGEILAPGVLRDVFCDSGKHAGFWTDGDMIEADANGNHTGPGPNYDYILFVDRNATDEPFIAMSIARALKSDVLAAVAAGKAPTFQKYYNPSHAPGPVGQFFTQPGLGGASTPIIVTPRIFIGEPAIRYDAYANEFVEIYQENQKNIAVSVATNLFSWSPPIEVVKLDPAGDMKLYNPSPVSKDTYPPVLGKTFYIYYFERRPQNTEPKLMRVTVDLK